MSAASKAMGAAPRALRPGWLLIPPLAFLVVFLGVPMLNILKLSLQVEGNWSLGNFTRFFSDPLYAKVMFLTLKTALIVTLSCLVLGYPVAYTMTFARKGARGLILIAVMIPFWTSLLVRTYAWMILLQTHGLVNRLLLDLRLVSEPVKLIYNSTGVVIGMTHVLLPYMILCLCSSMESIDKNLLSAGKSLGGHPFQVFSRIYVPLSAQGIASGSLLVFIMGIGYYITPALLGGQQDTMIAQLIQIQVGDLLNWGFASAIAFVLLAVTLLFLLVFKSFIRLDKLW